MRKPEEHNRISRQMKTEMKKTSGGKSCFPSGRDSLTVKMEDTSDMWTGSFRFIKRR